MNALDTFEQHILGIANRYKGDGAPKRRHDIESYCGTVIRAIEGYTENDSECPWPRRGWRGDLAKIKSPSIREDVMFDAVSLMLLCLEIGEMAGREQRKIIGTKAARKELQRKNDKRKAEHDDVLLVEAIQDEAKEQGRALADSTEFARLIQPGVCRRLGKEPGIKGLTTVSAIRTKIRKIRAHGISQLCQT